MQALCEAFFEDSAELGAGDHFGEADGEDLEILDGVGDFSLRDAQGKAFDHRGLADAFLADDDGADGAFLVQDFNQPF